MNTDERLERIEGKLNVIGDLLAAILKAQTHEADPPKGDRLSSLPQDIDPALILEELRRTRCMNQSLLLPHPVLLELIPQLVTPGERITKIARRLESDGHGSHQNSLYRLRESVEHAIARLRGINATQEHERRSS